MATIGESDQTSPAIDSSRDNLGVPEEFTVDPISSDVASFKEKAEARAKAKAEGEAAKRDLGSNLMLALVVSGVVVAAIGVAFIVTKELRK